MLQKIMTKKEKGFTLIELMIVIAIIGILAAIAVPQFLAYRMRAYNTAAKAVVHNLKADQANLNSEVGIYGHTEVAPQFLDDNDTDANAGAVNAVCGVEANSSLPLPTANLRRAARVQSTLIDGARLVATTDFAVPMTFRTQSIGIALGDNMIALSQDIMDTNSTTSCIVVARHFKGNTAYGIDSDIENAFYIVSNDNWPNNVTLAIGARIGAACPPPTLPAIGVDPDDFAPGGAPVNGNGAPIGTWSILR